MKRLKRSERTSNKRNQMLLEEIWLMRMHNIIIRPTISFFVEYFK